MMPMKKPFKKQLLSAILTIWFLAGEAVPEKTDIQKAPLKITKKEEGTILGNGPHLFLDDYLIESKTGLEFKVHSPEKYTGNPNEIELRMAARIASASLGKILGSTTIASGLGRRPCFTENLLISKFTWSSEIRGVVNCPVLINATMKSAPSHLDNMSNVLTTPSGFIIACE